MEEAKRLLVQLQDYQAFDEGEEVFRQKMIHRLTSEPGCFYRDSFPAHFTASTWLLNASADHVLLLFHRKIQKWLQPGGHCDGAARIEKQALKELEEETGISPHQLSILDSLFDLDIHTIPARKNEPEHEHFDIRICAQLTGTVEPRINHESEGYRWIALEEMLQENPSLSRMAKKSLKRFTHA